MRILFVAHDTIRCGSGLCLYEFIKMIKPEDGITPVVLTRNNNDLREAFLKMGVETYTCRFGGTMVRRPASVFFWGKIYRPITNFLAYWYLRLKMKLKKIDAIYANSTVIDFGAYLHRKTGVPLIWHLREFGDLDFDMVPFEKNISNYIESHAKGIIAVSNAVKKHFEDNGGTKNLAHCVYDGVIGRLYHPKLDKKNDEIVRICMCGNLCYPKGQLIAVNAVAKLPKEVQRKIRLHFYGTGYLEKPIQDFINQHGLVDIVSLKGFSKNLPQILPNYDIGLNLSRSEGFGRTTVEYMLSGLFVIGVNSGATPEILDYGREGTLIDANDEDALVRAITEIVNDKETFRKRGILSEQFARKNFCIENNHSKIVQTIKTVLS